MTKAIIFDCFGVLTTDTWREFTATLAEPQRAQARALNRAYGAGILPKADFLSEIHDLTGSQPEDIDRKLDSETFKNVALLDHIAVLKKHYKIGLLSNVASNWIKDRFLTLAEQELFDSFIFSFETGITKPDPRSFQNAADRLCVDVSEAIMIDDIASYCAAAAELGMKTIIYRDFQQMKTELEDLLRP